MNKLIQSILSETKEKIYVAMFGHNFVHIEKLVPAEDKEVEKILADQLQKVREETIERNDDIIFFAFRYALGRRTAAVSMMVDYISNHWSELKSHTQKQMQEEIKHAIAMDQAGQECDIKDWYKIVELALKDSSKGGRNLPSDKEEKR